MERMCCLFVFQLFGVVLFLNASVVGFTQGHDVGELRKKWDEYLLALGNVEGSYLYTTFRNGRKEREFTNRVVCVYPLFADVRDGSVEATGRKYRFELQRSDVADGWGVEYVSAGEPENAASWAFPEHFAATANHVGNPNGYKIFNALGVGLFGIDSDPNLPYIVTSNWVTIHELSLVERNSEPRFFLSFDYKQKNYSMKGEVFLTTDFFLVTEGEFYVENGTGIEEVQIKVEYDNETYRVPLPKFHYCKNSYNLGGDIPPGVFVTERRFDLKGTDPESSKYFTLSGYGIHEPDFGERQISPIRYVLMAIGILLVVFALWRMYWQHRESKT